MASDGEQRLKRLDGVISEQRMESEQTLERRNDDWWQVTVNKDTNDWMG